MTTLLLAIIYAAFISLGLPDSLLGAAWPAMHAQFAVPVSYAGAISITIFLGTIISSLISDGLNRRFGTGLVTAVSVAMTALALMGFSFTKSYWMMFLWAVPFGLGAGGVDAALNNYVALHYASRHMSWLHCMWGLGASLGPYIMGCALSRGAGWNMGYRWISFLQIGLTAVLLLSIPIWSKSGRMDASDINKPQSRTLRLREILAIPGAKEVFIAFFCYCAAEQTAILWASTYLVRHHGILEETAASLASLFFIGITAGRGANGFLTYRLTDKALIRLGEGIMLVGLTVMLLPIGEFSAMAGLLLLGLGCAPVYPCIIHSTPALFGPERSQAIIGVQMASAYIGGMVTPPVFGLVANHISASLLPVFLAAITLTMIIMHEKLNRKSDRENS